MPRSKRSQGTGSITYVESRKRHRVRYDSNKDGKPLNKFFKTKKEAEDFLADLRVRHKQGYNVDPDRMTVEELLERWLNEEVRGQLRPKTVLGYEGIVRVHLVPALGAIGLQKLSLSDVQGMINRLKASGRSPRTISMVRDVLRNALNYAIKADLIHGNLAELAKLPRQAPKKKLAMNLDQVADFIDKTEDRRYYALYCVALLAGLRISECLGLTWDNIDLESLDIKVVRQLQRLQGKVVVTPPKSDSGNRAFKIPTILVPILKAHRSRQLEAKLLAGDGWVPYDLDLVFTNSVGGPVDETRVRRDLKLAMESCGLAGFTMHDLRRTYCTMSKHLGVDDKTLQHNMGHTDIRLTLQVYTLAQEEQKANAANALDVAIRSRRTA